MKKLLYIVLILPILFTACGDDSENVVDSSKTYPVTFKVENFTVETSPIEGVKSTRSTFSLQYVIYKESGEVVKDVDETTALSGITISESLPEGNYYLAAVVRPGEYPKYTATNLSTDVCLGAGDKNNNFRFEIKPFTVYPAGGTVLVTLKPMWSAVTVNVIDKAKCGVPEGTNRVDLVWAPQTSGFKIKDKSGIPLEGGIRNTVSYTLESFRSPTLMTYESIAQSNDSDMKLVFMKDNEVLGERIIYKAAWETGYLYSLSGKLGGGISEEITEDFSFELQSTTAVSLPFE